MFSTSFPVHTSGTLDIFVGQQLLRVWMMVGEGALRILRVAISAFDREHSKYGDPPLRHHLHNH